MNSLIYFWQNLPSYMDPVFLQIGSFGIRWYSLMYIVAFTVVYWGVGKYRHAKQPLPNISSNFHSDLISTSFLFMIIGARLGYVLFYNLEYYLSHPLEIILPFDLKTGSFTGISGMSFHGGVIGAFIGSYRFIKKKSKLSFWQVVDYYAPFIPLAYTFGRLGNFINSELYGRVTNSSWGMYFPTDPNRLRHPSQLYESFFEGIISFLILWWLKDKIKTKGVIFALYLILYGFFRFFIEILRQPDAQFKDANDSIGFVFADFTMGQLLCVVMVLAGGLIIFYQKKKA